jgi:hypothetical protein
MMNAPLGTIGAIKPLDSFKALTESLIGVLVITSSYTSCRWALSTPITFENEKVINFKIVDS